jgi:hypothetical protein
MKRLFIALLIIASCQPVIPKEPVVYVRWFKNSEPDMASYRVYFWRTNLTTDGGFLTVTHPDTSQRFDGLYEQHPNQTIYFCVTAVDTANNESGYSDTAFVFTDHDIAPSVPGGVIAETVYE